MLRSRVLTVLLVIGWLTCGIVATLAGFFGFFSAWLSLLLLLPFGILGYLIWQLSKDFLVLSRFEKIVSIFLCITWLLHLLQVFVPETGFDAVWYHLPLAKLLLEQHRFVFLPELYQTANPQFADSIFALGFSFAQSLGSKLVAYGFALSLLTVTYRVARLFMTRTWSILILLAVSLFQVVAWQAGSFYIDVAKAFFEISALWMVFESMGRQPNAFKTKYLLVAGLSFSASLASKEFSLLLLPSFFYAIALATRNMKKRVVLTLLLVVFLLATPFYLFSWSQTGTLFYSMTKHVSSLATFSEADSPLKLFVARSIQLPNFLVSLFFTRDYTSLLLGLLPLALFALRKEIWQNKRLQILVIFTLNQLAIWWFVPPPSTRYALAGFITGLLLVFAWLASRKGKFLPIVVFCITLLLLLPRVLVARRSLIYLLGQQTQEKYIESLTDENNRWVIDTRYE